LLLPIDGYIFAVWVGYLWQRFWLPRRRAAGRRTVATTLRLNVFLQRKVIPGVLVRHCSCHCTVAVHCVRAGKPVTDHIRAAGIVWIGPVDDAIPVGVGV